MRGGSAVAVATPPEEAKVHDMFGSVFTPLTYAATIVELVPRVAVTPRGPLHLQPLNSSVLAIFYVSSGEL